MIHKVGYIQGMPGNVSPPLSITHSPLSTLVHIHAMDFWREKQPCAICACTISFCYLCVITHVVPYDSEDWLSLLAIQFRRHFTGHVKSCLCTYILSLVSFKMISMQRYTLIIICGIQQVLMQSAVSFSYISRAHYLMLEFWLLLSYHLTELVSI